MTKKRILCSVPSLRRTLGRFEDLLALPVIQSNNRGGASEVQEAQGEWLENGRVCAEGRLRVSRFASVVRWAAELRAKSAARDWLAVQDLPQAARSDDQPARRVKLGRMENGACAGPERPSAAELRRIQNRATGAGLRRNSVWLMGQRRRSSLSK